MKTEKIMEMGYIPPKGKVIARGYLARDDDRLTEVNFFNNKPEMVDWYWVSPTGQLGDEVLEIYLPDKVKGIKRGECKKCKIILEIEE